MNWKLITPLVLAGALALTQCQVVTAPVKAAGSIVTATVETTGDVVTAPFDAVAGREVRPRREREKDEDQDG